MRSQNRMQAFIARASEALEEPFDSHRIRAIILVLLTCVGAFLVHSNQTNNEHRSILPFIRASIDRRSISQELSSVVPTSRDFVLALEQKECRFPLFYDEEETHYPLRKSNGYIQPSTHWRDILKEDVGSEDADEVQDTIEYWASVHEPLPELKRNITFVHIGKAGGSSIKCQLRGQFWYSHGDHCDNYDQQDKNREFPVSAIARSVNCYTHWDSALKCFYLQDDANPKGNDYLVNLKSPVDRIASWFIYEHAENHDSVYPDRDYHCGQMTLNSCYRDFEHFAMLGLKGPQPDKSHPLKVGTNLTSEECERWAWATVQGTVPSDYHNAFNYDWYAHRMLFDSRSNTSDIFALRMEHLEHDWTTVDLMLGGTGSFPSALTKKQNSAEIKPYRVSHHNTTDAGIRNLCRALCEEIQIYKQLLTRAVNLEAADLALSMKELREQCPEESDLRPRQC